MTVLALSLDDVDDAVRRLVAVEIMAVTQHPRGAGRRHLVGDPPRRAPRATHDRDRHGHRGRRSLPAGGGGRDRHRGRRPRDRAEPHARAHRGGLRPAHRVGGSAAPVRGRCLTRAAHAGHDDPRLRRALPHRRARGSGRARARPCVARSRRPCAWGASSTISSSWPGSTKGGRPTARPSTSPRWPTTRCATRAPSPPTGTSRSTPTAPSSCRATRPASARWWPTSSATRWSTPLARRSRCGFGSPTAWPSSRWPTSGAGMAEADAARAFERFYRADASRSRHHGGSGLGLAIVEATVRGHGGTVHLTSAPSQGTTVTVTLPLT